MPRISAEGILRKFVLFCVAGACVGANASAAQTQQARAGANAVRVLMVSDIHFDPFADPAKVENLIDTPADKWAGVLSTPPSPDAAEKFRALQKNCDAKGVDTNYRLLASSMDAMRTEAADARFVLVSGDLLVHEFSCRYETTVAHATAEGYNAFAAKTLEFVMDELRGAIPGVPVYAALGNNDSGCGDYRIDSGGAFLRDVEPALSADLPAAERAHARRDIMAGGYYSVALPAPMEQTRLLVLDDLFMSREYATCGGSPDPAPAVEQIQWLRSQLRQARRNHEKVWVMAHIPPGIDPFSTIKKIAAVCAGGRPQMFLSSNALLGTIAEFTDVVRLAVFAHTHMDELRLLRAANTGAEGQSVAVKMVPSISPVHGNAPAFVVAGVNPASAVLKDYRVIAASNGTGVETKWGEEYDFDRAYGEKDFSAASLQALIAGFRADNAASTAASQEYLRNYYAGDRSALLKLFWPQYTCALANDSAAGFRSCACSGDAAQ